LLWKKSDAVSSPITLFITSSWKHY
jgi:hypothetical protein